MGTRTDRSDSVLRGRRGKHLMVSPTVNGKWLAGSGILAYLAREVLKALSLAFGLVIAVYSLVSLIPGDPVMALLGDRATAATRAALTERLHLDVSWPVRMVHYVRQVFVHADLGESFRSGMPITELLSSRVGATLGIAVNAIVIAGISGIILAVISAYRRGRIADQLVRIVTTIGLSMPAFWIGILLIVVCAKRLHLLPAGGLDTSTLFSLERSLLLPSLVAALPIIPLVVRSLRLEIIKVLAADHVLFAQAVGISEVRIFFTRVLRGSVVPMIAILALNFAYLLGGSLIVERVFGISGLGSVLFDSVSARDIPVVQGVVLVTGVAVIIVNAIAAIVVELVSGRHASRGKVPRGQVPGPPVGTLTTLKAN
ncbi:MAG: ABC transporter permease [Gordonia sp. (in: high G+C Gram-positive bacteria)]